MAIMWRNSALAHRHAEIGGELEDWNGMGTAWFYVDTPERAKLITKQFAPKRA